jgi:hypothetical protein
VINLEQDRNIGQTKLRWYMRVTLPFILASYHIIFVKTPFLIAYTTSFELFILRLILLVASILYLILSITIMYPKMNIEKPFDKDRSRTYAYLAMLLAASMLAFMSAMFFQAGISIETVLMILPAFVMYYYTVKWSRMDEKS